MSALFQELTPPIGSRLEQREPHARPWRKGSVFDMGGQFRRPLDRNDRAKIMAAAESLERRTKAPGKRDGVIGVSGLMILRAMLYHFMDSKSGRCDPSYKQIQARTGLCIQTIASALKALAMTGLLEIVRRIERQRERAINPLTGAWQWIVRVVQQTNAYMINFPLPDRRESGDLAVPLLRKSFGFPRDSTLQRESTSIFNQSVTGRQKEEKKEAIEGSSLARALASLGQAIAAREKMTA